jgi:hypothetical protein
VFLWVRMNRQIQCTSCGIVSHHQDLGEEENKYELLTGVHHLAKYSISSSRVLRSVGFWFWLPFTLGIMLPVEGDERASTIQVQGICLLDCDWGRENIT